jgi:predicted ATPase
MPLSRELRLLQAKWNTGLGWPQRLEWVEIHNIRGWKGHRIPLNFPITAIVGENGSGKSTVLQVSASVYKGSTKKLTRFASDFFPSTAWDKITQARIIYGYRQGQKSSVGQINKPSDRWLRNPDRPTRNVVYVDLSRIQPVGGRIGYAKIAKSRHKEASSTAFDPAKMKRLSGIMGRHYDGAKMALTDIDAKRFVPVLSQHAKPYSGFHQGAGETTIAEFLRVDVPEYSLVLIDEIETSLHPRAQRRLIRDLADQCREKQVQIILTTHSPYILEELPLEARSYIMEAGDKRQTVAGVSPAFAMTKMDDEIHPDCDLYVEDEAAAAMLNEILARYSPTLVRQCRIIPYGSAQVGTALGQMVEQNRFPRASLVFLDGDNSQAPGCILLPGGDAPERVIFEGLKQKNWSDLSARVGRYFADVADACNTAMTLGNHHDWVRSAATKLTLGGNILWQAMCAEWVGVLAEEPMSKAIVAVIEDELARRAAA